jgi:hypothetical protein
MNFVMATAANRLDALKGVLMPHLAELLRGDDARFVMHLKILLQSALNASELVSSQHPQDQTRR